MEPVVPALHALGRGVGDILPAVCPPHLIPLTLHQRNKFLFGRCVAHTLVDGIHESELPTLALGRGAVLPGVHALLLDLFLWRRQNLQTVSNADLIVGLTMGLQVGGTLMELVTVLERDAVHHQVVVQVIGVYVGGHQHLEVRELPLGQLQADGVNFLGRQVVLFAEGLDEVVVLPPIRFPVPLLGELHFREGGLGGAVPTGHQPLPFPQCLFFLLGVPQHSSERTPASAPVLDGGESSRLRSPPAGVAGAAR